MGKLHELLAVEGDLKGRAAKVLAETINTFKNKGGHFDSLHRAYKPDTEDGLVQPEETKPMVETVTKKLDYTAKALGDLLDVTFQKESTNTNAKADLVLGDGTVIAKDVPATVLLSLEGKLAQFKEMYESIPTLDPSEEWKWDDKETSFRTENSKTRSKKQIRNHVVAEGTKEHPAQVQVYNEDVRIGLVTEIKHSSKFTSAAKSELLGRLDTMIQSTKRARQRANNTNASREVIGARVFGYINQGLLQ